MKCSLDEFVELCMGFCDGSLTMDEDLEVHRMITVDAEGVPSGLVEDTSSTTGLKKLEQDIAQDVNNFLSPKRSYKGSNWSNESLASATSVGNVDYLEANERDTELSDTSDISHQMELLASDSGAGEGLCDDDTTDSPLKKAGDSNWQMKPPNVMVYCGKKDSQRKFDNVKAILEQCLNPECYVIYHLQHDMVHNVPWDDNTALLIVSGHHLSDNVDQAFFGPSVCYYCLMNFDDIFQVLLDKDPTDVAITPQMFDQLKSSNKDRFDILFNILTVLGMDCEKNKLPSLTPCFLLYRNETIKTNFINSIEQRLKNGILKSSSVSLQFVLDGQMEVAAPSPNLLPVLFKTDDHALHYISEEKYWSNLTSQVYGNTVLYVDVIPTTMPLFDGLQYSVPDDVGLVAIAGRQTSGKGNYRYKLIGIIVKLNNIDLRLKWPNDIYYSNKIKLGGVIVKSTIIDHVLHAVIGCGFNVSNNNPTICINDLIHLYNSEHRTALPPCSTDQLIARTVSHIEQLIDQFQKNGRNSFCQMYYKKWLHSNCKVKLEGEGGIEVTIIGVDEYGYLDVVTEKGQRLTVQPDGNSFDMMRNLITFKIN
ncbi:hypothetical protein KUTeg_005423 [Tegillarca granosa]|uniref:BPL/LPL catalytic domain-containing protein n=1 Tax=Tegillarca granosa TaxID=220873 RepID=A0ABQ9FJP9_TEGGR|nr:hypothetical protein KUTeg_005423 [Tegillarca granosa]